MQDLREVVAPMPVSPLPGGSRGIAGLVIHHGEFLPVLAWGEFPGCQAASAPPLALAVLRLRLGLPLDWLGGTLDLGPEVWRETPADDPWGPWVDAVARVGGKDLPRLDLDGLIGLLRRFRDER
jgi:chemotaxis signal transduction protein